MSTRIESGDGLGQLYSVRKTDDKGQVLYYNFEEVKLNNYDYWKEYKLFAKYFAELCKNFCREIHESSCPPYPNRYSDEFRCDREKYDKIVEFVKRKRYFEKDIFKQVWGGIMGMSYALEDYSEPDRIVFMVYASNVPIKEPHTQKTFGNQDGCFKRIIISYVFTTSDNVSVTHYGIFRNPLSFLDLEENYRELSIKLHGFGASMALKLFRAKRYMVTCPMPSMIQIFIKYLKPGEIFMGTNEDLKNFHKMTPEQQVLLKKYPPRFHKGPEDYYMDGDRIAKKNVDLSDYLEFLPIKLAKFEGFHNRKIDFSFDTTDGALKTVIKLKKLASFFGNIES